MKRIHHFLLSTFALFAALSFGAAASHAGKTTIRNCTKNKIMVKTYRSDDKKMSSYANKYYISAGKSKKVSCPITKKCNLRIQKSGSRTSHKYKKRSGGWLYTDGGLKSGRSCK